MAKDWTLEEAQKNLRELLKAALEGSPQYILTASGKKVVVISYAMFEAMLPEGARPKRQSS